MSGFWRNAMMAWGFSVALFGIVLMGGAFAATQGMTVFLYKVMGGSTPPMDAALRFSVGLMGAVTFGWGLTVLVAASVSDRIDTTVARIMWSRMTWAFLAWYLVDSAISITTGFWLNAVSNTVFMGIFTMIVWRSHKAPGKAV